MATYSTSGKLVESGSTLVTKISMNNTCIVLGSQNGPFKIHSKRLPKTIDFAFVQVLINS
jgi:hypothetical protein